MSDSTLSVDLFLAASSLETNSSVPMRQLDEPVVRQLRGSLSGSAVTRRGGGGKEGVGGGGG